MASICLFSLNYSPEPIGIGPYSKGWAEGLAARGHDVCVICGVPYYPDWSLLGGFKQEFSETVEGGVKVLRVPHYIPANPTGVRRLVHYATFAANAARAARRLEKVFTPDAVLAIAPALAAAPVALRMAARTGAVSWLHMQDFEVEAALATGLLPRPVASAGARFEKAVVSKFAQASSISPRMISKVAGLRKDGAPVHELRNWAEPLVGGGTSNGASMRRKLGLPKGTVALYSGNLARKQGVGAILEAASALSGKKDLHIVVCGAGPAAPEVEQASARLPNLHFRPLQPREDLPHLMAMADLHLLPQIAAAADLVLPSKLANMLASGRPVVAIADKGTSLAQEVEGCGAVVSTGDSAGFATAIASLADAPEQRSALGMTARDRAARNWSRQAILAQFGEALEQAIEERNS